MLLAQISLIVFVLFLSYHDQCDGKSHYDTLGVSRGSSGKVITKKYRELAKKLHPDKNKHDPGAQEKFIEVSEAYEVLSNVNSRKDYDYELKFGGSNWSNQHQNNHNRRENGGFHNFNNEEVFFFRGPDGRIFTTSARNQFPNSGQQYEEQFQQEDNFFSNTFEHFFPTNEPKSTFGWISFISITLLFTFITITFFVCSFLFAFCDAFPLTAVFAGVFLTFVVIFSPSLCTCCRSGKGRGRGKEMGKSMKYEPKCVRYERKSENNSESIAVEGNTDTDLLPDFELKMMIKGRITVICLTENISRICTSLRLKYTQSPFHFSKYVTHNELLNLSDSADLSCIGVGSEDGLRVGISISAIAVFGNGTQWAYFPSNTTSISTSAVSQMDNIDNNFNNNTDDSTDYNTDNKSDKRADNNMNKDINTLNNPNSNNQDSSSIGEMNNSTSENTNKNVNKNISVDANVNTNISVSTDLSDYTVRDALDVWLDRILDGMCPRVRTVDQPIPYILGVHQEII